MTASHAALEKQARESYNEPSSLLGHSPHPALLGSILSTTPGNFSFAKDPLGPLRVSEPIGIPRAAHVDVGCSPMSFPSFRDGIGMPPSPAASQLAAAMAAHRTAAAPSSSSYRPAAGSLTAASNSGDSLTPDSAPVAVHQNWRLGLFTEVASNAAMREVYDALRLQGFEWKVHTPYHLIAKLVVAAAGAVDPPVDVCLGVQLYRMQERHDKGYLVDLYILGDAVLQAADHIHRLYLHLTMKIGA